MKDEFLGHAIKRDRKSLGISQAQLQQLIRDESIRLTDRLTQKEKDELIGKTENFLRFEGKQIWCDVPSKLISNIERGVARNVTPQDLSLIASILKQDPERYLDLEVNPMKLMNTENEVNSVDRDKNYFERSIQFQPEYRQAGVSILSFFSEIVRDEFPNQDVRIGIFQTDNTVTLRVETPEGGLLKEVDRALEKFGMVVMGSIKPENISSNPELVRDLKTRLEVTNLELRLRQESYIASSRHYEGRISSLEEQVKQLHGMIGSNLAHQSSLGEILSNMVSRDEMNSNLGKALDILENLSTSEDSYDNHEKLNSVIDEINSASPGLLIRLARTLESIPANIMSNLASPWVQSILIGLPT